MQEKYLNKYQNNKIITSLDAKSAKMFVYIFICLSKVILNKILMFKDISDIHIAS